MTNNNKQQSCCKWTKIKVLKKNFTKCISPCLNKVKKKRSIRIEQPFQPVDRVQSKYIDKIEINKCWKVCMEFYELWTFCRNRKFNWAQQFYAIVFVCFLSVKSAIKREIVAIFFFPAFFIHFAEANFWRTIAYSPASY